MSVPDASTEIRNTSEIQPYQTMRGHTDYVQGVAHLHDGRHIVTSSRDDSLRLWDRESGAQIGNDWRDDGDNARVYNIALSPNGMTLASGSSDGTMRLWDVETKKAIAKWTGHADLVRSVCWSADGKRVASGSNDGTMQMWNMESGQTDLGPIKTGHNKVRAVAYSPDISKIATGGSDKHAIKIWDARTGELLSTLRQDSPVWSLAWDQKKLIAGIGYGSIRIFDTVTWEKIAILEDHTDVVCAISLFHNDRLLASGSWDRTVRLWNLDTNLPIGPPLRHRDWVNDVALSTDGKFLATACEDKNAYVWDIHAILNGAGLEDLLSIPNVTNTKSILDSNATRRSPKFHDTHSIPRNFFSDVRDGIHSSAPSTDPLPVTAHPDHLSPIARPDSPVPTTNADPPASTSHTNPPSSTHRRYNVAHLRALFRRHVPLFRRSQSNTDLPNIDPPASMSFFHRHVQRFRRSEPNTVEPMELQRQLSQHILSVHEPADVQIPSTSTPKHPISQSPNPSSTIIRSRLRYLLNRRSIHPGDALVPIVGVPLAQGLERNATAGAPKKDNGGYRRDEEFDTRPPSPIAHSQQAQAPAPARIDTGEHGSGRLCCCL